jgi:Nicotinic acid phosphoribosyltransferase
VTAVGLEGTLKGTLLYSDIKTSHLSGTQRYVWLYQVYVQQAYRWHTGPNLETPVCDVTGKTDPNNTGYLTFGSLHQSCSYLESLLSLQMFWVQLAAYTVQKKIFILMLHVVIFFYMLLVVYRYQKRSV